MAEPMSAPSLVRRQYARPDQLRTRQRLWSYHTGRSWMDDALDTVGARGGETVLDVGCGAGRWLAALRRRGHTGRLLGVDISPGMAAAAAERTGAAALVADAVALPLPDATADVALAAHMLYHTPEVPAAVAELRRVVRPGGVVLATTNGARHIAEIRAVMDEAAARVGARRRAITPSFTLENGEEILGASFTRVRRHERVAAVVVPAVEPVVDYVASFDDPQLVGLPAGTPWRDFLAEVDRIVRDHVRRHGAFTVTRHPGFFVCA
ncbi:MAG TPA: class I SAM-dependent methyltransferase [Natronosporangium sp.]|nr:class I SAM-dependent methyltransferase [Natronosporangium sp.]